MPITAVPSSEAMGEGQTSTTDSSAGVPAWMAARRERRASAPTPETVTDTSIVAADDDTIIRSVAASESAPVVTFESEPSADLFSFPPSLPSRKSDLSPPTAPVKVAKQLKPGWVGVVKNWLSQYFSSQSMIGMGVSLLLHATVLVLLAFVIMANVTKHEDMSLWGVVDTGDEVGGNVIFDATIPLDTGESAPLMQMTSDLTDVIQAGVGTEVAKAVQSGKGGKGKSDGESGDGTSMGVSSPKIPGYAQTKGSFSAWPEPRDPKPMENYHIVIRINLPRAVKTYRASDLTGLVTGTDKYRQEIRDKSGEKIDVIDGQVEIRILVPGGGQRVRDTVRVESKLLREKQTFEIEF